VPERLLLSAWPRHNPLGTTQHLSVKLGWVVWLSGNQSSAWGGWVRRREPRLPRPGRRRPRATLPRHYSHKYPSRSDALLI